MLITVIEISVIYCLMEGVSVFMCVWRNCVVRDTSVWDDFVYVRISNAIRTSQLNGCHAYLVFWKN